jgi:hypothetical protein
VWHPGLRSALGVAVLGALTAAITERWLMATSGAAGRTTPEPVTTFVVIDAPIERVWAALADVGAQPRWMRDIKSLRVFGENPIGVGTRAEATVRVFGIPVRDPVTIMEFEPPHRYGVRHEGLIRGHGVFELRSGSDDASTIVTWDETLVAPVLPFLWSLASRRIFQAVFQADLHRLRELVEMTHGAEPTAVVRAA